MYLLLINVVSLLIEISFLSFFSMSLNSLILFFISVKVLYNVILNSLTFTYISKISSNKLYYVLISVFNFLIASLVLVHNLHLLFVLTIFIASIIEFDDELNTVLIVSYINSVFTLSFVSLNFYLVLYFLFLYVVGLIILLY
jgi:hypothetical protein